MSPALYQLSYLAKEPYRADGAYDTKFYVQASTAGGSAHMRPVGTWSEKYGKLARKWRK